MKFDRPYTLKEISSLITAEFIGNEDFLVYGTNEIHRVETGEIVFVDHPKYYDKALQSKASVVLINKKIPCPEGKALLISEDPFRDFNILNLHFTQFTPTHQPLAKTAKLGNGTHIQPNVFIGEHVKIGENCLIHANVVLQNYTQIGNNVIINSGTIIGGDAFYYKNRNTFYDKLQSVGNVIIEDDVEIGSNCTIDRGVTASTIIGKGTKIDNLVQIGHDTVIGQQCLIASQVGIAGCCTLGNQVTLWGQVGLRSGITLADNVEVYAQSGISKDLEEGKKYFGSPAHEAREMFKQLAALKNLPNYISKK